VKVTNQGTAASGEFLLAWWAERDIASASSCQWTIAGGLSPGGTAVMACDYTYDRSGPLNSRAAADPGNAVLEEDEDNNILDMAVSVAAVRHLFTLPADDSFLQYPGTAAWEEGIEKDLATGWKISYDWQTLTIYLHEGVSLVGGRPFTAREVKKKWEEIPGWAYPGYVDEVVIVDDYTIQFIMWQYDTLPAYTLAEFEFVTMN